MVLSEKQGEEYDLGGKMGTENVKICWEQIMVKDSSIYFCVTHKGEQLREERKVIKLSIGIF